MEKEAAKKGNKYISKIIEKMKSNKKFELMVYGVLVAIALIIYVLSTPIGKEEKPSETSVSTTGAIINEADTEEKLAKILSSIRGAGEVKVMITYETGKQIVPAMSKETKTSSSDGADTSSVDESESSKPATVNKDGEDEPIVLTEIQPEVRGVIVIAEGAADIGVRLSLQQAVQTVLGISMESIDVFEMGKAYE